MDAREELEQELEWKRCEANIFYFLEHYWHISVPGSSPLFELRPPQIDALEVWLTGQDSICLKARQIGWSTLFAGFAFWKVFFNGNFSVGALSRTEKEAQKLLKKSKYGYARLPEWFKQRGPALDKENLLELTFDNESRIEAMASRENAARGDTFALIGVDEWAFLNDPEEAWASIKPAADIGGQIIGISTAKGYGNWFHRFYKAAEAGNNGFKALFYNWQSVPGRDEKWYQEQTVSMEPWQLHQEFPTTVDEAFVSSGDVVYETDMLKERIQVLHPLYVGNVTMTTRQEVDMSLAPDGPTSVWELPQPGMTYVIGADVAAGVPDGDYSTATVIKANTNKVVAVFRQRLVPEDFSESLDLLGRWFNNAYLAVERNNHGITVCRDLSQKLQYPNLHFHTNENIQRSSSRNVGFQTTVATKPLLVNELGAALRRGKLIIHCADTLSELIGFQRQTSKSGQYEVFNGYPHDDLVMSLGIANMMLFEVNVTVSQIEEKPDGLTWDICERMMAAAPKSSAKMMAGYNYKQKPEENPRFTVYGPV